MQKAALELGLQRYRVVIRLEGPGLPQAGGTRGERQRVRGEAVSVGRGGNRGRLRTAVVCIWGGRKGGWGLCQAGLNEIQGEAGPGGPHCVQRAWSFS